MQGGELSRFNKSLFQGVCNVADAYPSTGSGIEANITQKVSICNKLQQANKPLIISDDIYINENVMSNARLKDYTMDHDIVVQLNIITLRQT